MKKQLLYILSTLAVISGCRSENVIPEEQPEVFLTARMEDGSATRVQFSDPEGGVYHPLWSSGDEVAVLLDRNLVPDRYVLVDGAGTAKARFKGSVSGTRYVALYPYSTYPSRQPDGNAIEFSLPDIQDYQDGSVGSNAFPMIGVGDTPDLRFKNLCAVLRIPMVGDTYVRSVRFTATDRGMGVCGKARVRTDYGSVPELEMCDGSSCSVTLECPAVKLNLTTPVDFFIVLPPGLYKGGFSIDIETFNGTVTRSTDKDVLFQRSQFRSIPLLTCTGSGQFDPDDLPYDTIWYVTENGQKIDFPSYAFPQAILSHTYSDGKGVLVFDGPMVEMGDHAFYHTKLTEIHLPQTIRSISAEAFAGTLIKSVRLPSSLTYLGVNCFADCPELETVTVQSTFETVLPYDPFANTPKLRRFDGESDIVLSDRCLTTPDGAMISFAGAGVEEYTIPEGVTTVMTGVFKDRYVLRSITFPSSIENQTAFPLIRNCPMLEFFYGPGTSDDHHCLIKKDALCAVTQVLPPVFKVPSSVKTIRSLTGFEGNSQLQQLILSDGVSAVESYVIRNNPNLHSVTMSSTLESLNCAGNFEGCPQLDSIFMRAPVPPSLTQPYFPVHDGFILFVPEQTIDVYKSAPGWSDYSAYMQGWVPDNLDNPDYYYSTDFSRDGAVTKLQSASEGAGIDIVLMGDAFSDRLIADGTYDTVMQKMADALFTEEPYRSFRRLFNIYQIDVVSATEGYSQGGQALGGTFGEGTRVGGNDAKCMEYALKAVGQERMDNVLIVVAMNSPAYGGTCYMYNPVTGGDYGCGTSVAYFPVGESDTQLTRLVLHEAGGHGFAKLDDEYFSVENGTAPAEKVAERREKETWGWCKNVDFTPNASAVKWSKFLVDSRYTAEGLGVFEGAMTYAYGAFRPSEYSIMRYNTGGYNAPSREAIWYRIHKLAYGTGWTYVYEEFVAWDTINRKPAASAAASPRSVRGTRPLSEMPPLAAPVFRDCTWRDAD